MKASLLCLATVLSAGLSLNAAEVTTIYTPAEDFEAVFRAQGPPQTYEGAVPFDSSVPPNGGPYTVPQGQTFDPNMGGGNLYGAPPNTYDPFLTPGAGGGDPYGGQPMPGYSGAVNGPQPYRFGWSSRYEFGFLPKSRTYVAPTGTPGGNFSQIETDIGLKYTTPTRNGWIFGFSPEVDYRGWDGPQTVSLPGKGFRFASDFELSTPANGLWSVQLGFTPAVGTDFSNSLSSDAWMFDARAVLFFRPSDTWMFAAGAAYWDRVGDYIIPYAGIVWTPNDLWEVRAMFPKARVSRFLGDMGGKSVWVYGSFEYDIEAFQVQRTGITGRDQVEFKDYVMMLGIRSDNGCRSLFLEAGGIMKREADFKSGGGFDIKDGFIARFGVQF